MKKLLIHIIIGASIGTVVGFSMVAVKSYFLQKDLMELMRFNAKLKDDLIDVQRMRIDMYRQTVRFQDEKIKQLESDCK